MKKLLLFLLILSFSLTPTFPAHRDLEHIAYVHPVQEVVYVTKSGSKYHKGTCHYLKKSKIKTTKTEAKNAGYSPCSVCKP